MNVNNFFVSGLDREEDSACGTADEGDMKGSNEMIGGGWTNSERTSLKSPDKIGGIPK